MTIDATSVTHALGTRVWEQDRRDLLRDTLKTARDVGRVRLDHSRLNVFSSLSEGDKEDHFKFKVASPGKLRLGLYYDDETRIQIFNKQGRVIADSKEGTGLLLERFQRMIDDGEPFKAGDYYVRVSRLDQNETTPERPYGLQLRMGTVVKHDYDTTEYKAKAAKPGDLMLDDPTAGAMPNAALTAGGMLSGIMAAGMSNLSKLLDPLTNFLFGGGHN